MSAHNKSIIVMLACNDPHNGHCRNRCDSIHVGSSNSIELHGPEIRTNISGNKVRLGRRIFRHVGMGTWVGNWCWDAAWVEPETCVEILNWLVERGFECECAESSIFDKLKRKEPVTVSDLDGLVGLGEP